jgi:hypothetical protein
VSKKTVGAHKQGIKEKLGLSRRFAVDAGLLR